MSTPRVPLGLFSILVAFLITTPTFAARPTVQVLPIDETAVLSAADTGCTSDVTRLIEGTIRVTTRTSRSGTTVEVDQVHLHGSFSANGKSVNFTVAETDKVTFNQDGSVTVVTTGLIGKITVPHQGVVTADVGRIIVTYDQSSNATTTFEAGRHDNGPFPFLCDTLAS